MLNVQNEKFMSMISEQAELVLAYRVELDMYPWVNKSLFVTELKPIYIKQLCSEIEAATPLDMNKNYTDEELMAGGFHYLAKKYYRTQRGTTKQGHKVKETTLEAQNMKPGQFADQLEVDKTYELPEGMKLAGVRTACYNRGYKIKPTLAKGKWFIYRIT